ncbi:Uncharacterised protein [Chryseobacterium nakagawai]|uniref:Uncharacterized protein n=1 Tax=Chryseobacterium nakagawai TaxID=1241982 RepID=A0AAD1DR01_CHRNA|nr:hypothetical protein [Chryseobacterium nakagawai]AZA90935.1 hypothetical protein EG343_09950 [Chryseobacterium nakagawai]VEH22473.1 Uncharacterised protein [Chryseobacterium nakagawai]
MKKLLFLLLPIFAFSQTNFRKLDSLEFKKTVEQLITDTGRNYQLVTDRSDDDVNNLKYENTQDKSDVLLIKYGSYMDGENKDLEKRGVKKWAISAVYGKYLAVFPIWKKYADPKADIDILSKKGFKMLANFNITRYDDQGFWRLSF